MAKISEMAYTAYRKFVRNRMYSKALDVLSASYADDIPATYPYIKQFRQAMATLARGGSEKAMELIRRSYLLTAKDCFDDYCTFLEWDRPLKNRFYAPRRKQLLPVVNALQSLADDQLDLLCISMPPGVGKALANDTPVLTRSGWKQHGDLAVGDEVIGADGEYKRVLAVHPKCVLDRVVEFSNGERIQCHARHEWTVYSRGAREYKTLETQQLEGRSLEYGGEHGKRGHRYAYQLPPHIVIGEEKELFSPYFLGVWLGDGTNTTPTITNHVSDYAIIEKIAEEGYSPRHKYTQDRQPGTVWYNYDIRQELHKYGMCYDRRRTEKHIPEEYLTASIRQRLELLAGLIDTDGTLQGSKYTFTTCDTELRDSFVELLSTFGWRACVTVHKPCVSSSGIVGRKDTYCISFTPDRRVPCAIERKRNKEPHKQRAIAISKIGKTEPKEGNCITVEGGVYLVGKTMIPTHNSALSMFFLTWLAGRKPEEGILSGSHNASFLRGMYEEILRILDPDGEYNFAEIFPAAKVVRTNALDMKIDVERAQRFSTFQMASIGGGNAGKVRAVQLLYCDDLIEGIEEALSRDRLDKKWNLYSTDLRQRKQGGCKELHIATRWSITDIIGRLQVEYNNNKRAAFISVPALNDKDESNFDYGGSIGFTTQFYHDMRDLMDEASFNALYQNSPIERTGVLYNADELRRYFELPSEEPDAVWAVCDTKDKGDDYYVMPIAYQYGQDFYIERIICDNKTPEAVLPRLVATLMAHHVKQCRFESNAAGGQIAEKVKEKLKEQGGITNITTKYSTAGKDTRILVDSSYVKEHFLFKASDKYDYDYKIAMNFLTSYSMVGKNKHDDVPDAFSMLANFVQGSRTTIAVVMKRPF